MKTAFFEYEIFLCQEENFARKRKTGDGNFTRLKSPFLLYATVFSKYSVTIKFQIGYLCHGKKKYRIHLQTFVILHKGFSYSEISEEISFPV